MYSIRDKFPEILKVFEKQKLNTDKEKQDIRF